jgi:competence protein ComEA
VVVPKRGLAGASVGPGGTGTANGPVHLSTATLDQLDSLPGIGPVTAQKILDYRAKHGAFSSVDELDAVPGIGPSRMDQLRDLVAP